MLRALGASPAMTMSDGLFGVARRRRSRVAARGRRGDRALPALAHRPGAPGLSLARDRGGLRGARLRAARADRRSSEPLPSCSPTGRRQAELARNEHRPGEVRAWRAWRRTPARPFPRSRASASRSNRVTAGPLRPSAWPLPVPTLAVLIVVAALTFGSGLSTLVSHPALYGWNWNYALTSANTECLRRSCPCWPATGPWPHGAACRYVLAESRSTARPCQSSWRAHMRESARRCSRGTPLKRTTRSSSARRRLPSCTSRLATPSSRPTERRTMPPSTSRQCAW